MKLYLSSYRIPDIDALTALMGKPPGETRVALIPNAKDYYIPRAKAVKARTVITDLQAFDFTVDVVDLQEYIGAAAKLAEKLSGYDMLWAMGGNTFCLREAMQRSGFDTIIQDLLSGGLVFAGESAGACVAGSDLHGIELADVAEFAEIVIWDGLKLVPHYFLPHADNAEFVKVVEKVTAERGDDSTLVVLNDNQAWVVNGTDEKKVTGTKAISSAEVA